MKEDLKTDPKKRIPTHKSACGLHEVKINGKSSVTPFYSRDRILVFPLYRAKTLGGNDNANKANKHHGGSHRLSMLHSHIPPEGSGDHTRECLWSDEGRHHQQQIRASDNYCQVRFRSHMGK